MNILIICGHGGTPYDPGAVGCGYKEAELVREQGRLLLQELHKVSGVTPILYDQSKDAYKVLKGGGKLPLSGIDYVMELHFNAGAGDAGGNGRTTGVEVLVHTSERSAGTESAIVRGIAALGFTNRGVKRRSNLLVMNMVKRYGVSHCLIETCFMDDKDDMTLYQTKRTAVAAAIAQGVAEGFGLRYKEENEDMTQEQFQMMYDQVNPLYTSIAGVPEWYRAEAQELKDAGVLKGDGKHEISIRLEGLQGAVIALRAVKANKA